MKYVPSLEEGRGANVVAKFCLIHMKYVPSVEDGRGSGKKVATPRTEHLFPTVSSLIQEIHIYSIVSSLKKIIPASSLF